MTHSEIAEQMFLNGYNCAQSLVGAFSDVLQMDQADAVKLASSFGGGISRLRSVCGAVSGIAIVIGLLYGYSDPNDYDAKKKQYETVQCLIKQFEAKHHAIDCMTLLGGNADTAPTPTPRTESFYQTRPCALLIADAADILDGYIRSVGK